MGETSADAVARHVRQLVIDGVLRKGQRLPQDQIAAAVGVSRIPVREAIIALEREGWLRVEPHRGAFVNGLDDEAVIDHYELHGRYVGFAARRAIARMSPTQLAELDRLAERLAGAVSPAETERASRAYVDGLVAVSSSARLEVALRSMVPIVPANFYTAVPDAVVAQQRGVARLHRAVRDGDAEAAERAWIATEVEQAGRVIALLRAHHITAGATAS